MGRGYLVSHSNHVRRWSFEVFLHHFLPFSPDQPALDIALDLRERERERERGGGKRKRESRRDVGKEEEK